MEIVASILDHLHFPLQLDYASAPYAFAFFLLLAIPIVYLGRRSLRYLGPARQWTAIGVRLALLWVLVLTLAGARWVRTNRDVEVVVVRDVSSSTAAVATPAGKTLPRTLDEFLKSSVKSKPPADRIGLVSFDVDAAVDALPAHDLRFNAGAIRSASPDGTDLSAGIRLGLASFDPDVRKRLLLISDGNANRGDTAAAISAAIALHIPVDVLPLEYNIRRETLVEQIHAPTWVRDGDPYSIDVSLRSTSPLATPGKLTVTRQNAPLDLDSNTLGIQPILHVTLNPGLNAFHIKVPPSDAAGVHNFRASFVPDDPADDTLTANNAAEAFTFVRGQGKVLVVDNLPDNQSAAILAAIPDSVRITPDEFPASLVDLEPYHAILLANVPRGPGGLSEQQERVLTRYVQDLGGGLIVLGGPDALGAGNWQGSQLEKILPVNMDIPARRIIPAGALVLVLDDSGSMSQPMPGGTTSKQETANLAAALALRTMLPGDRVGVVAFNSTPSWAIPLASNVDPVASESKIRKIQPGGNTDIFAALQMAYEGIAKLSSSEVSVKHILLLTDGMSEPGDYDTLLAKCRERKITLSTVAVGPDADTKLLASLASRGHGAAYVVNSASQLTQVFVREARTLRRSLIHEPDGGIFPVVQPDAASLLAGLPFDPPPLLTGMVLTSRKLDPTVQVPLVSAAKEHDPILAFWQTGLGRTAVFTSDLSPRWSANWIASPVYQPFLKQLVRSVSRPPMSSEFELSTTRDGDKTKLVIDASNSAGRSLDFFTFAGHLSSPDAREPSTPFRLLQTGPGRYEATLSTGAPGSYVAAVRYAGPNNAAGTLLAGVSVPASAESRDLRSDDSLLTQIATRTGGRIHPFPGRGPAINLFSREGLPTSQSSHPIQDLLITALISITLLDVAVRRIAWDWPALKRLASTAAHHIRQFTLSSHHPATAAAATLAALRHRDGSSTSDIASPSPFPGTPGEGQGEGLALRRPIHHETTQADTPPKRRAQPTSATSSLFDAKRRAQQQNNRERNG